MITKVFYAYTALTESSKLHVGSAFKHMVHHPKLMWTFTKHDAKKMTNVTLFLGIEDFVNGTLVDANVDSSGRRRRCEHGPQDPQSDQ